MRTPLAALAVLAGHSLASAAAPADPVSLREERELFPDVLEVITGKFVHHSADFYLWQIKDRQSKLAADPDNPDLNTELAVALARTGQPGQADQAVGILEKVEKAHPGRYDTLARLGLIYVLKDQPQKALAPLDKALALQPDAHDGRERYLRWLAEYLAEKPGRRLPVSPLDPKSDWPHRPRSFATFLRGKLNKPDLELADAQAAVRGLLGSMRIGAHESSAFLEALGDVLCYSSDPAKVVAPRLACRSFLRAGYVVPNPGVRKQYIALAEWALVHRKNEGSAYDQAVESTPLLTRLFEEVADADAWKEGMKQKERELVAASPNPEAEFDRQFTEAPRSPDEPNDDWFTRNQGSLFVAGAAGIPALALLAAGIVLVVRLARRGSKGQRGGPADTLPE